MRLREEGPAITGIVLLTPRTYFPDLLDRLEEARAAANKVDWRLYDVEVVARRSGAERDG